MDESFTLDDIEQSEIERAAETPNVDNITVCSCRSICLRESGRNACPCKTISQFCSTACHPDGRTCMNRRNVLGGDSSSEESQETTTDSSDDGRSVRGTTGRGRRGGRRGRRGGRRGRPSGRARGRDRSPAGQRGRGTNIQNRATGRRERGRGRGSLVAEDNSQQRGADHEQQLQNLVQNLNIDVLQQLALELLRRQPAVFADLINGEMPVDNQNEVAQPVVAEDVPGDDTSPDWCMCGLCRAMETQVENKCCCRTKMACITTTPLFHQLVLDGNVLDLSMRYREDVLALDHPRNNENFRHAAYRQYVLWQHGRLGQGNRRVVPSCCVLAIRSRFPSPNGMYTGFLPARL